MLLAHSARGSKTGSRFVRGLQLMLKTPEPGYVLQSACDFPDRGAFPAAGVYQTPVHICANVLGLSPLQAFPLPRARPSTTTAW